jgi:HAD superfamily hydrolase (TIGR01549 family)
VVLCVLFDLDGTILDCIGPLEKAFVESVERVGARITAEGKQNVSNNLAKILSNRSGLFNFLSIWQLTGYLGIPAHKRLPLILISINNLKKVAKSCDIFSGSSEVLEELKRSGMRMAIVTTRGKKDTFALLKRHSLGAYFQAVVTRDDVRRSKPSPDPVLFALKQLEIQPHDAVMVGDMPTDIQAGKSAGTKTVGITESLFQKELIESSPDFLIRSITEFPRILGKLNSS